MTVAVSLVGVHTHTHTHTNSLVNKKEEIKINKDSNIMPICIG